MDLRTIFKRAVNVFIVKFLELFVQTHALSRFHLIDFATLATHDGWEVGAIQHLDREERVLCT